MIIPKGGSPTKKSFPKLWILKVKSTKTIRPIKRLLPKVIPEFCEFILKEQIVLKISGVLSQTSFASFASFVTFDRIEDWNLWLIYGHWHWRVLGEEKDKKEEKTLLEGEHLSKCQICNTLGWWHTFFLSLSYCWEKMGKQVMHVWQEMGERRKRRMSKMGSCQVVD